MDYRLDLPNKTYGTIYADPPWRLRTGGVKRKLHYDTMSLEEIKSLPIGAVCIPAAHLWLWAPNSHLPEALEVVIAWGFEYKTLLTWDKEKMGLGWWLRGQTEHCIFAVRPGASRQIPRKLTTVLRSPRRSHSQKPEEMYAIIEQLSPGPYLELFARLARGRIQWDYLISDSPPVGDPYGMG